MMKSIYILMVRLVAVICAISLNNLNAEESKIKELKTGLKSSFYISDAAFYKAKGEKAIVFVPGFIFNKESWKFLAEQFQLQGVASLALSGNSDQIVKSAVKKLTKKGYTDIILIGGSSGAAAILEALKSLQGINKVILLSPPRGGPILIDSVDKLFIASEEERLFPVVNKIFDESSYPKKIEIFEGSAHAQFLFYGSNRIQLIDLIKNFVDY